MDYQEYSRLDQDEKVINKLKFTQENLRELTNTFEKDNLKKSKNYIYFNESNEHWLPEPFRKSKFLESQARVIIKEMLAVNIQDFKIKFEVIVNLLQKQLLKTVQEFKEECDRLNQNF